MFSKRRKIATVPTSVEVSDILDRHALGNNEYDAGTFNDIGNYFQNKEDPIPWRGVSEGNADGDGGICAVSWYENDRIELVIFNYKHKKG